MTDDLVKRLRSPEVFIDTGGMFSPVANEAADLIEAQDKRNKELEAALREICSIRAQKRGSASFAMLIIAAAALGEKKDG